MSASRKLFIAAMLVSTGLGVAYLLGKPISLPQALESNSAAPSQVAFAAVPQASPSVSWSANRVQLLPESVVSQTQTPAMESAALQNPLLPIAAAAPIANSTGNTSSPFAQPPAINASASVGSSSRAEAGAPLGRLRNEAPRPVGNDPRSPATIRRTPTSLPDAGATVQASDPYKTMSSWPASPQVMPTGFASEPSSPQAITTAYGTTAPAANSMNAPPALPAWADRETAVEPESHVVVDGDSLERLAGRYLDDPHRGPEIYNLNRDVLTNPDMLPIGVELKIPDRASRTSWDRQSQRPGVSNESTVRQAASGNLVPVRPMSSFENLTPRAQLAPPLAAE